MIRGLVYVSKEEISFYAESLKELAARAASRNAELSVTGYLYYSEGRFLQYLEGESQTVEGLFSRIAADPRHDVVTSLCEDTVSDRRFPTWHMRWLNAGSTKHIELEGVLSDHLVFLQTLKEISPTNHSWHPRVWSMIDKLAETQQRLGLL